MRTIIGLSEDGLIRLQEHLARSGNEVDIPFEVALARLIAVVTPQINNPDPELAVEPWFFAIGVAGMTYPKTADEHETSDYEEICLRYYKTDFQIEETVP